MKMVQVKLEGLAWDMTADTPVVILSQDEPDKVLPIWIGHAEASAILMALSGVASKRPLTHDLMKQAIEALEATVTRVEITELRDQTFYAVIVLKRNGDGRTLDARPSDSIALALKTGCPIYVNSDLFEPRLKGDQETPPMPTDRESLRERLRKINPEDFGKYPL